MPYLSEYYQDLVDGGYPPKKPGELNYAITKRLIQYVETNGLSYATINDIMGALEGAKHEFYMRVAFPYECQKRMENPDVYADIAPGE